MNIVDELVKKSIINHFDIFPSRIHVLRHCLLCNGTGYEWVEHDDGLLYLECYLESDIEDKSSIKMLKLENVLNDSVLSFENITRAWVNENIDEYCLKSFSYHTIDLRPKSTKNILSRGYNRLCDITDMSKISPVWQNAIKEVSEYYMRIMSSSGVCPTMREGLDSIRHDRDTYLILYNAYHKVQDLKPNEQKSLRALLRDMNDGKSKEELFQEDWQAKFSDTMTFEKFMELRNWFKDNYDPFINRSEMSSHIKKYIKTREMYINDSGHLNSKFYDDYNKVLPTLGWTYFDEPSVTSIITRALKISPYYKNLVASNVALDICTCFGS